MSDCIFCKIARGEIPARVVYQNDFVVAFHDVNPQAPVHVLVITKKHIPDLRDLKWDPAGRMFDAIRKVATELDLGEKGFRVVFNTGPQAGQSVQHIHAHVLGGQEMGWPPFPAGSPK